MLTDNSDGYIRLARSAVHQALQDAMEHKDAYERHKAICWLASEDGQEWADLTGFDIQLINRWLAAGCPALELDKTGGKNELD